MSLAIQLQQPYRKHYNPLEYWFANVSATNESSLRDGIEVKSNVSISQWSPDISNSLETVEGLLPFINKLFPESSNSSPNNLMMENLVVEDKELVESGSSSLFWLKRYTKKPRVFNSTLKCEGLVLSVEGDEFTAKLIDLNKIAADEIAVFPFNEISDDDKRLVQPGAVFYWNVGYETLPSGQKNRSSVIRFRRLPAWSPKDLQKAEERADHLQKILGW